MYFSPEGPYKKIPSALDIEHQWFIRGLPKVTEEELTIGKHVRKRYYLAITLISFRRVSLNDLPTGMLFKESPTIRSSEFSLIVWIMLLLIMYDL